MANEMSTSVEKAQDDAVKRRVKGEFVRGVSVFRSVLGECSNFPTDRNPLKTCIFFVKKTNFELNIKIQNLLRTTFQKSLNTKVSNSVQQAYSLLLHLLVHLNVSLSGANVFVPSHFHYDFRRHTGMGQLRDEPAATTL